MHASKSIALLIVLASISHPLCAADAPVSRVKVQVDPRTVVARIAPDFIGFGYETSAAAQPNYFSAKNTVLVRLYRNLSSQGLIRIGGNISDHTRYVPHGTAAARSEKEVTIVNQASLAGLGEFARVTGWKVMWGLNLFSGTKAAAVEEALAVNAALGGALHSLEIGNEVDLHLKTYDAYRAAYLDYRSAIRGKLPDAPFSGPDVANRLAWLATFANAEGKDAKLLTHHYYRGGANNPNATIETLLKHDDPWDARLEKLRQVSRDSGIGYRINEVNSYYGGGKAGVSDTFASALWCLDYLFVLASHGCAGVNMETDINQHAWVSHYSPIVHDAQGNCRPRPEYYGMLAFALAGMGDLLGLTLEKGDVNLSAYATRDHQGYLWITVVNKDFSRDAEVEVRLPDGYTAAAAFRLTAPTPESKQQVTLAGAEVSADGTWTAGLPEKATVKEGLARVRTPHASAVLLRLEPSRGGAAAK